MTSYDNTWIMTSWSRQIMTSLMILHVPVVLLSDNFLHISTMLFMTLPHHRCHGTHQKVEQLQEWNIDSSLKNSYPSHLHNNNNNNNNNRCLFGRICFITLSVRSLLTFDFRGFGRLGFGYSTWPSFACQRLRKQLGKELSMLCNCLTCGWTTTTTSTSSSSSAMQWDTTRHIQTQWSTTR